jgi:heme exporter protein B
MSRISNITVLMKKDLVLDFRKKFALGGILLYLVTIVFICYRSFLSLDPLSWNVLLWILFLFLALNTVLKSFTQENSGRVLYYYFSVDPYDYIIAKILYNWILLIVMGTILILVYSFFLGFPVAQIGQFSGAFLLTSLGISVCFSFASSIASQMQNSGTMVAILSLPLIIPILLSIIKVTGISIEAESFLEVNSDFISLAAIDLILLGASVLLFPFIWRS